MILRRWLIRSKRDLRQDLIDLMQAQVSTKNELAYLEQENQRNSRAKTS